MSENNATRIILVRPRNPGNVGAVARAMANFGLDDLVLVSPYPPIWEEARAAAVGAGDVIAKARVVDTVLEAVDDCALAIGTVDSRRGEGISPDEAVKLIAECSGRAAVIFGCEKSGLANADLSFCQKVLTIPTSEECPSLNLAHAVAIVCYELSQRATAPGPEQRISKGEAKSASIGEIEVFLRKSIDLLKASGYFAGGNEERLTQEFRQSLVRLRPTARELTLWTGAVHQVTSTVRRGHA